jgi:hypothetical protein
VPFQSGDGLAFVTDSIKDCEKTEMSLRHAWPS